MRPHLVAGLLALGAAPFAFAGQSPPTISTAGVELRVPGAWYATVSRTPKCDPERLLVVASTPIRIGRGGALAPPRRGQVLILVLEVRYRQDRPVGDLRRPAHFAVTWNHLVRLKAICGNPDAPAFMRYIRTHSRYIGFIVYPGAKLATSERAKTLAVMDSLRVST